MSESQDPIRQQLIEARRNQILDAAAKVFAQKGFPRATTKEIARTAGVSEGTIYNYFGSKDDLLIGMMARLAQAMRLKEMLDQGLPDDPREFLVAMLRYRQAMVEQHYEMLQTIISEILVNTELGERYYQQLVLPFIEQLERHIQSRVEMGQIRPVNAPLFVRVLVIISIGLFLGLALGDPVVRSEWDNLVEALADIILDGVRPATAEAA